MNELKKLEVDKVKSKIRYIEQKFSESRLSEFNSKKESYNKENVRLNKATELDKNLKSLLDLYNENVNKYISSISESIEILFHIYSGRLLQNFHNGLGVFIETDGKSVSFKDSPSTDHDVIYSMCSGQLSSLVIAFTMALNNRYAKKKLLLIDDPVQTMDEINVAGFIDLLRHQFKDRQIFISTHEDHISSYFRYKFNKAGLTQERINFNKLFKEELLSAQ